MNEDNNSGGRRLRRASTSTIPKANIIDDLDTFKRVVKLLREGTKVKVAQSQAAEREREIKEELAAICEAYGLSGLRHGLDEFEYYGWKTRSALSKERLLALGVPAETIASAYVESAPFLSTKIDPFDLD